MPALYLDTSAYMKRFKREAGSRSIRRLFRLAETGAGELLIVTSEWTINESLSAIRRWRSDDVRLRTEAAAFIAETRRLSNFDGFEFVEITSELCQRSRPLIVERRLSAGDALQLHAARVARCDAFVSADDRLLAAARTESLVPVNARKPRELRTLVSNFGIA